jgi:hypothetical protein
VAWASYRELVGSLFIVAAINLVLAAALNNSGRLIAVLAVPGFLVAGTLARRVV